MKHHFCRRLWGRETDPSPFPSGSGAGRAVEGASLASRTRRRCGVRSWGENGSVRSAPRLRMGSALCSAPRAVISANGSLLGIFKQRPLHFHCKSPPSPSPPLREGHKGSGPARLGLLGDPRAEPARGVRTAKGPRSRSTSSKKLQKLPRARSRGTRVESGDGDRDSPKRPRGAGAGSAGVQSISCIPRDGWLGAGSVGTQPTWHRRLGLHFRDSRKMRVFFFFSSPP